MARVSICVGCRFSLLRASACASFHSSHADDCAPRLLRAPLFRVTISLAELHQQDKSCARVSLSGISSTLARLDYAILLSHLHHMQTVHLLHERKSLLVQQTRRAISFLQETKPKSPIFAKRLSGGLSPPTRVQTTHLHRLAEPWSDSKKSSVD